MCVFIYTYTFCMCIYFTYVYTYIYIYILFYNDTHEYNVYICIYIYIQCASTLLFVLGRSGAFRNGFLALGGFGQRISPGKNGKVTPLPQDTFPLGKLAKQSGRFMETHGFYRNI